MNDNQLYSYIEELTFPKLPYRSVKKDYSVLKNVNKKACAQCGGLCCKRCGCHFSPDDFQEISFDFLKKELEKGYISIDFVNGEMILEDFGVYILRIRNQDSPIVDTGYGKNNCILLTPNGCKLNYKHRPTGGKLLIPSEELRPGLLGEPPRRKCISSYDIRKCCYEWKPHKKLLYELSEYFKDKDFPCSL